MHDQQTSMDGETVAIMAALALGLLLTVAYLIVIFGQAH